MQWLFSLVAVIASSSHVAPDTQPLPATDLRVEQLPCPTIVGVARPSFSWKLLHPSRGASQSAYHVTVSASGKMVWDSGVVPSNVTLGVRVSHVHV